MTRDAIDSVIESSDLCNEKIQELYGIFIGDAAFFFSSASFSTTNIKQAYVVGKIN